MPIRSSRYPILYSIRHGFGTGAAITDGQIAREFGTVEHDEGQLAGSSAYYTNTMIVPATADVRDGQDNNTGSLVQTHTAANADQIWIPDSNGTSYVVVWVTLIGRGTVIKEREKKVYLNRAVAVWSAPISGRP